MDLSVQILAKYDQLEKAREMLKALQDEYVDVCNAIKEKKLSPDTLKDVYTDIGKVGDNAVVLQKQLVDLAKTFDKLSDSERKQLDVPLFSGQNSQAMNVVKDIVDKTNESYKNLLSTLENNETINAASSSIGIMEQSANSACSAIRQISSATSSLGDISAKMASLDPSKDSAQILEYNQYINNLTRDIERSKQTLEGWNSGMSESANASSAFTDAQKVLSDAIAKQQGNVDSLTAQIKQLNSEYAQAKGSNILTIGAQKSGLENQLATQMGVLDKLKIKAAEMQQAYDNAASASNNALLGLSNAMEQVANSKFGSSISEQFEKVRASIVVATDSMSMVNAEFRNIAINKSRIDDLSSAISKLDANTQGGAISRLEAEMQKCNVAIDESVAKIAKWSANTKNFDDANKSAEEAIANLNDMINVQQGCVDNLASKLASLKEAYKTATDSNKASISEEMQQVQTSLDGEQYSLNMIKATLNGVSAEWNNMKQHRMNALNGSANAYTNAISAQKTIQSETKKTTSESLAQQKAVDGLKSTWTQFLGAIGVASGLKAFISQLIEVNARMEQVKTSLYGIMESKNQADSLFNSIKDVSSHSAIGLGSLTGVAQQFIAFGESAERIPKLLEAMNEVSMGSEQRFNRIASSLQMMAAMGQVNTRTIRSMITAGFNPLMAISQKTGESVSDLMKKVKKGTIPVSEITNAFLDATQKGGMFYKMNDKMSGTLTYQFAIMKKSVAAFFLELGKQNDGTIKSITATIVNLTKHIKDFTEAAKIIVTFAGIKTAAYLASQAIMGLATAMKIATGATIGLSTAMKASGWGTIIALVSTLGVAVYDFVTSTKEATSATEKLNKVVNESTSDVDELFTIINNTNSTSNVHKETLEKLVDKYKEYGINIDTSKGLLADEVNITNELIAKKGILIGLIREEAFERAKADQYKSYQAEREEKYKNVRKKVVNKLKDEKGEAVANGLAISVVDVLQKASQKFRTTSKDKIDTFEHFQETHKNDEILQELRYQGKYASLYEVDKKGEFYVSDRTIAKLETLHEITKVLGKSWRDLGVYFNDDMFHLMMQLEGIDNQEKEFTETVNENSDTLDVNARRARYNRLSIDELGATIRNLIENYHDNDITFHINVDDAQVPEWMKKKGWSSQGFKNMASFYLSVLNDMKSKHEKYRYIKGPDGKPHRLSQEDVANRLAQYQKQSETKKAEEDKAAAEKEEKEKEAEKQERAAEAARRKEEERQRRIKEATDNYNSSIKNAVSDLSSDTEQQKNDLKDDSVEKKMRNAELTYNKAVKDADNKIEDVAKSLYALNKAKGSVVKSVDQLKKEILAAGESNSEFGSLIKAYNEALKLAGLQLGKAQSKIVDELKSTYDKDSYERAEKMKKLQSDIAALEDMVKKARTDGEKEQSTKLLNNANEQLNWLAQSKDAWNEYYQKYGTFLEKRKALEEKFLHDTQGVDENTPEYLMLKKQKEEAEATLEAEEKLKGFDWMDAFGDLSKLSNTTLENVKNQLKDIIELDKTLNASDKAKFVEKYNKASDEIEKRKESWSDYTGNNWISNAFKKNQQDKYERKKREEEYERAKQNYKDKIDENNTAQSEKILADENLKDKEGALNDFLQQNGSSLNADSFQGMDMSQALQMLQQNGGDFSQMGQQFKSLFSGFQGAQQGAQTAAANASQAAQAMQGAQQGMQAAQGALGGGGGGGGAAMTEAIIKGINQNVQSLNQLVKKFGNEDSGFAQGMQDFAESSQEATEAFDSFKNGDVFGTILHLSNAVEKLGSSMAKFFGYNDGEVEYQKELKRYKKMSKIWDDLIEKKKKYISLTYGNETKKEINEINALYKAEEASIRTLTKRFSNKRTWNAHSQSYRNTQSINQKALELGAVKLNAFDYANNFEYLKALAGNGNYGFNAWSKASGVNISRLEDLYEKDYSYKELLSLKTAANGEYYGSLGEEIQTYMDKLIEAKKAQEDFAEDMKEKLTGVKFDTMVSDFMSCLEDMSQGADDWVNSFKDKIRKAIIDNMMGNQVKEWLEDYTKRYQDAMNKGTLTDAERQQFINEANEKSNEFFNERKELLENIGLGKSSDSSSSGGGFATASEESVEELSGRALAANEALYSIRNIQIDYKTYMKDIQNNLQGLKMSFDVSREIQENSYMELVEIRKNTGSSSNILEQMKSELYTIRKKVENI